MEEAQLETAWPANPLPPRLVGKVGDFDRSKRVYRESQGLGGEGCR